MLCVLDANILIDFAAVGLLETLFRLPFRFTLPDLLAAELLSPSVARLQQLGVEVTGFTEAEVLDIVTLGRAHPPLSVGDRAVLVAARMANAVLLTGDMQLRELARSLTIEVHGTLWLLEELERRGILIPQTAIAALEGMRRSGRRLPEQECARLLRRWQSGQALK